MWTVDVFCIFLGCVARVKALGATKGSLVLFNSRERLMKSLVATLSDYPGSSLSKRIGGLQLIVYLHRAVCNVFDKLSSSSRPV